VLAIATSSGPARCGDWAGSVRELLSTPAQAVLASLDVNESSREERKIAPGELLTVPRGRNIDL
jgi:hypothetical protein